MDRTPHVLFTRFVAVALSVVLCAAGARSAVAQGAPRFPAIPVWGYAGAWQDSSEFSRTRCIGAMGPRSDSLRAQARTITVRFLRDRLAEKRPDFGGYRVYRMTNERDSSRAMLLRRFSRNSGSELTWNFSVMDTAANSYNYKCRGTVVHDSIVTFIDADSNGQFVKVCRRPGDFTGRCFTPGDSVYRLLAPPGPHDGFRTWYSVTYEKRNTTDTDDEDLFVNDGAGNNLNHKLANVTEGIEPTAGPSANLEHVSVVPNPYRGGEVWDGPAQAELHFINLPANASIRIYTLSGDFVRELHHTDNVRDFERWDLTSGAGKQVASGIYVFRIEAASFSFQNRFVVIR